MIAQPGIALVSTRQSTAGRLGQAVRLACNLAARGLVIFSAPVRGVDAARIAAIAAKGRNGAVLGTGGHPHLSQAKHSADGTDCDSGRGSDLGIPDEHSCGTAKYSPFASSVVFPSADDAQYRGAGLPDAVPRNRIVSFFDVPGNVTNKNSFGPNLDQAGSETNRDLGRVYGRNCLRKCELALTSTVAMNRRPGKLHLYSGKRTLDRRFSSC